MIKRIRGASFFKLQIVIDYKNHSPSLNLRNNISKFKNRQKKGRISLSILYLLLD